MIIEDRYLDAEILHITKRIEEENYKSVISFPAVSPYHGSRVTLYYAQIKIQGSCGIPSGCLFLKSHKNTRLMWDTFGLPIPKVPPFKGDPLVLEASK